METGQRGQNKVSALAEELFDQPAPVRKLSDDVIMAEASSDNKRDYAVPVPSSKGGSETCHFCEKRVYVVERMSAEGKFFHRSCFRCDYCNILLRLGSYVYHREGPFGGKKNGNPFRSGRKPEAFLIFPHIMLNRRLRVCRSHRLLWEMLIAH